MRRVKIGGLWIHPARFTVEQPAPHFLRVQLKLGVDTDEDIKLRAIYNADILANMHTCTYISVLSENFVHGKMWWNGRNNNGEYTLHGVGDLEDYLPFRSAPTGFVINPAKCECGVDAAGVGGLHSSWCPKAGLSGANSEES